MSSLPVPHMNPYQHASEEEYLAFVERHCEGKDSLKLYRKSRERFVQTYPDLMQWFTAPLEERIGRTFGQGQGQYTHQASYEARQYLFYLAMRNYVTFDWEWLIALPKIHLRHMLA